MSNNKVILTAAVTGSMHVPSMSPYLPITAQQIVDSSIEAVEAGASIIHVHGRHEDGRPAQTPESYGSFLHDINKATDAVISITTGTIPFGPVDERIAPCIEFKPEMASLNMGTMNFSIYHLMERFKDVDLLPWEKEHLESSRELVLRNTFEDIEYVMKKLGSDGTRFELECYDISHLYNLARFAERGIIKPPFFVQYIFGSNGGIGAHMEDIVHAKRTADRLFGDNYLWSAVMTGLQTHTLATRCASLGGNVRVGLEDNLFISEGKLAKSNAEHVTLARQIFENAGMQIATPAEARTMLQLKGQDKVNF